MKINIQEVEEIIDTLPTQEGEEYLYNQIQECGDRKLKISLWKIYVSRYGIKVT